MEILTAWHILGIIVAWTMMGVFGSFRLLLLHMKYGDVYHENMTDVEFAMNVWLYMMFVIGGPGTIVMNWIARIDAKITGNLPWMPDEEMPTRKPTGLGWPIKLEIK